MQAKKRAIDKIYKRRDRYEIPDWQRQEVWSRSKKQNLIDTILRGWKLPKFYFLRLSDEPEQYEVVDGQQRLVTILEFFDNELPLPDKTAKEFQGRFYRDLTDKVKDTFDDYEIEYDEIEDATEEEVKAFFQRLQDGLPLTSSEKLNSIHSNLRDFVRKLTKHNFLQKISASDKRYGHFDIVAKTAAIEIDGIETGLRYDDLRALFESQAAFSSRSNVAKRLLAALDFADKAFTPDQAARLRNRTVIQSLLTLVCRLLQTGNADKLHAHVSDFFLAFLGELNQQVELGQKATDHEYLRFQRSVNANIKSGPRIRQEILLRKLLGHAPRVAALLDPATVAESGLKSAVKSLAADIARLIAECNERYSSKNGTDLFKATNKTTQALTGIGVPAQDFDGYKNLIDNLYFLFVEAPGTRLEAKTPESFSDVNTLRTALRHDLNHGKPAKSRSRRRRAGDVFLKFGGAPSPAGLPPEMFVVVQANILSALKVDLGGLHW